MIDRRAFLRRLGFGTVAAAAAANGALDIERLLWSKEKTIFIPPPPTIATLSEIFQIGDVFTIAGRYAVNPLTYQPTSHLQRFVITQTVSSGEILTRDKLWPPPKHDGPYKNIDKPVDERIDARLITPIMWGDVIPCKVNYVK